MMELIQQREEVRRELNDAIIFRKNCGRALAQAEHDYKRCRTLWMHRIMIEGYEGSKPIAATAAYDFVQGIPEVVEYKLERDLKQADLDVTVERINQKKLELRILDGDIRAIGKGE